MRPVRWPAPRARRVALLLLLLLALGVAWKGFRIADAAGRAQRDAEMVAGLVSAGLTDPASIRALLDGDTRIVSATASMRDLQTELRPLDPLLRMTAVGPTDYRWIADLPDVLDVLVPVLQTGALGSELLGRSSTGREDDGRGGLAGLVVRAPELRRLAIDLDRADAALARVSEHPLQGPLRRLQQPLDALTEVWPELRTAIGSFAALGPALGAEGPRTYLILGQNDKEIRATGGFIGSVGVITLDRGRVMDLRYGSSYVVDDAVAPPAPPAPYARYLGLGGWYLRDANWWVDWPSSAAQIQLAWQRAGHAPPDGIIAFDTVAIQRMLRAVGPLAVPGYGTVNADTFEQLAAEQLYTPEAVARAGGFHRAKGAFLAPVGRALLQTLAGGPPSDFLALRDVVEGLLDEKHIQVALKDPQALDLLFARGWSGAVPPILDDSLMVVDTTVSYGDAYPFIRTDVQVEVSLAEDGTRVHDVRLRYENQYPRGIPPWMPPAMLEGTRYDISTGRFTSTVGFWGNWLRVYVPLGAQQLQVEGLADTAPAHQELGRDVVAGYVALPPGAEQAVRLRYQTKGAEDSATYRLYLQKQAGLVCRPVTLVVHWSDQTSATYTGCPTSDGWIELERAGRDRSG
jgi:hypothetical protein